MNHFQYYDSLKYYLSSVLNSKVKCELCYTLLSQLLVLRRILVLQCPKSVSKQ